MASFRVTDRTSPKIHGKFRNPGDVVELDLSDLSDRLIADKLQDDKTLIAMEPVRMPDPAPAEAAPPPPPPPNPTSGPPKRKRGRPRKNP